MAITTAALIILSIGFFANQKSTALTMGDISQGLNNAAGTDVGALSSVMVYPTGSLVNDNATIYFISGTTKIPFTSWKAFVGLGYSLHNVVNGDLSNYSLPQIYILSNINMVHPWGSWLLYNGTVYYSAQQGLIPVPSWAVFLNNGGQSKFIVKANKYDLAVLKGNPNLPPLVANDPRVTGQAVVVPCCKQAPGGLLPATTTTSSSNTTPPPGSNLNQGYVLTSPPTSSPTPIIILPPPNPTPIPTSTPATTTSVSLLYNPGPDYISGKTIVDDVSKTAVTAPWVSAGTSLAQASLVGNPPGLCPQGLQGTNVDNVTNMPASNGACESYYNDTRFWWKSTDWQKWPGWDVSVSGAGNGTPLELSYANHAYPLSQCTSQVREVGVSFDGSSSIRPNTSLGQFKDITGSFDLNISAQNINPALSCPSGYEAPFQNVTDPWGYVSGDFRVNYFKPDGTWVRGDIFSVHVYNAQPVANKDIFWQGSSCVVNPANNQYGCTVMINPSAAGISFSAISPGSGYHTFSIDFKGLYEKYVTPPSGFTADDAVVGGYDVYSSLRGVDMNFSLKNINLVGTK